MRKPIDVFTHHHAFSDARISVLNTRSSHTHSLYAHPVQTRRFAMAVSASLLSTFLVLGGCASAPVPTEQFALSQAAIESANTAGAAEYAPVEIKSARDKLSAAQRAVDAKEYPAASALAEEATVDAKLAETKAESAKAQKSVHEIQDNLRTLLDEINRNQQQQIQSEQKSQSGSSS